MSDSISAITTHNNHAFYSFLAKGLEGAKTGISKVNNAFWKHVADIPEFPVKGKILGQKHWKKLEVSIEKGCIPIDIKKKSNISWVKVLKEIGNNIEGYVDINLEQNIMQLRFSKNATDAEVKALIKEINNLPCIEYCEAKGEITLVEELQTRHLDTSTGIVYEGAKWRISANWIRIKATIIPLGMPIYALSTIAYNLLKILPTAIFLIGHAFHEYYNQKDTRNRRSFKAIVWDHAKDINKETLNSFRNVMRTPFFATGMLGGAVWAMVDPFNGMKIISSFEYHWNHRISKYKPSLHTIVCVPTKNFQRKNLFVGGTYILAPCMQPVGVMKLDAEGNIPENVIYYLPEDMTDYQKTDLKAHYKVKSILDMN